MSKITFRSGTSIARGTTMDLLLDEQDTQALYERWKNEWGAPIGLRAGEVLITAEMVSAVPLAELVSTYGRVRAARLMEIAKKNAMV